MTSPKPVPPDKSRTIEVHRKEGETEDQAIAGVMVRGTVSNASTVVDFSHALYPGLSLTDISRALLQQGEAVNRGDLASLERLLNGQIVALNAMFTELARRGALNMGEHLDATDRYIRLALRAQSQARATVETIAAIKNPPLVFARQANINNGGQQQINNSQVSGVVSKETGHPGLDAASRAGETTVAQIEQSGASHELLEDTRTSQAAVGAHSSMAPVGEVNRPAKP